MKEINNKTIYTSLIKTPIKTMFAASFKQKLILFTPYNKSVVQKRLKELQKILKVDKIEEDEKQFSKLILELDEYFSNKRKEFTIEFETFGTPFQKKCWEALLKIPYGKTINYEEEATNIGNKKAFRAVANANGKNDLSIIIPCHRVVRKNGHLGGYTGGVEIKEFLLALEKKEK